MAKKNNDIEIPVFDPNKSFDTIDVGTDETPVFDPNKSFDVKKKVRYMEEIRYMKECRIRV